jgi:hypothetical protein
LFFYQDLPAQDPAFEAVQKLSLLGAVDGDENYFFHPNQPITLGEFARLVVNGFQLPISITAAHFVDVPRGHPEFKFIETLYDYSTQSTNPFFEYEIRNYLNYWWGDQAGSGPPAFAHPGQAVTVDMAVSIVSGLLGEPINEAEDTGHNMTRSEAVMLIYDLVKQR